MNFCGLTFNAHGVSRATLQRLPLSGCGSCFVGLFRNVDTGCIERCDECAIFPDGDAAARAAEKFGLLPSTCEQCAAQLASIGVHARSLDVSVCQQCFTSDEASQ